MEKTKSFTRYLGRYSAMVQRLRTLVPAVLLEVCDVGYREVSKHGKRALSVRRDEGGAELWHHSGIMQVLCHSIYFAGLTR